MPLFRIVSGATSSKLALLFFINGSSTYPIDGVQFYVNCICNLTFSNSNCNHNSLFQHVIVKVIERLLK